MKLNGTLQLLVYAVIILGEPSGHENFGGWGGWCNTTAVKFNFIQFIYSLH